MITNTSIVSSHKFTTWLLLFCFLKAWIRIVHIVPNKLLESDIQYLRKLKESESKSLSDLNLKSITSVLTIRFAGISDYFWGYTRFILLIPFYFQKVCPTGQNSLAISNITYHHVSVTRMEEWNPFVIYCHIQSQIKLGLEFRIESETTHLSKL